MGSKVFLSYRRSDAKWAAIAIENILENLLGKDSVFRDLNSIAPGSNWRESLNSALDECEVSLIVIGDQWIDALDSTGRRCIDRDDDMVRLEIVKSLERGIPVVPVLLDEAQLPSARDLPDDISELLDRQAVAVKHGTYKSDVEDLVARLELHGHQAGSGAPPPHSLIQGLTSSPDHERRDILITFLNRYRQWAFSATRIVNWGARQEHFASLGNYSAAEIRSELEKMVEDGIAITRTSKKGGTLYKLK